MKSTNCDRKQIYVDRQVQGGIALRLLLLWLAATALSVTVGVLLEFFSNPTMGFAQHLSSVGQHLFPLLLAFAATLPIAILYLFRFTHRFAGPVIRLRRSLQELAAGKTSQPLKFRDDDYWQDLAVEFNKVAESLAQARRRIAELEHGDDWTDDDQGGLAAAATHAPVATL